jgi:hypothetical protein
MQQTAALPSLGAIRRRSERAADSGGPALDRPVDRSRRFVCETLTPLYYAPIYRELTGAQRLRYNQITGLCFGELIAFFEESFAASVLAALALARQDPDDDLAACLDGFVAEERRHVAYWRRLNRLAEPSWYARRDECVIRLPAAARRALGFLTSRPRTFPAVFWVMLALEERSLDISRRCLRMEPDAAEPSFREAYRHHLRDEARHVQLDRHLIERYYAPLPRRRREWNARLLALLIGRFFLPPTRSAARVVGLLAREFPEIEPRRREITQQLRSVGRDPAYHEMMYSRSTTPRTFALFDRFPEMRRMERVLHSYRYDGFGQSSPVTP